MGTQLPEEAGPRLRLERPSEHVAGVVIDAPAVANALSDLRHLLAGPAGGG